jgi:hypothetical protein
MSVDLGGARAGRRTVRSERRVLISSQEQINVVVDWLEEALGHLYDSTRDSSVFFLLEQFGLFVGSLLNFF